MEGHQCAGEHYYDRTRLQDNQYIFLRHYYQMLLTCGEGFQFIKKRIDNENIFDVKMFKDCIDALIAIEDANFLIWNMMKEIDKDVHDNVRAFAELKPVMEKILLYQEENNLDSLSKTLSTELFPEFLAWSEKVQNVLVKYIQN